MIQRNPMPPKARTVSLGVLPHITAVYMRPHTPGQLKIKSLTARQAIILFAIHFFDAAFSHIKFALSSWLYPLVVSK